jgi:hypothetical protein
MRDGSTRSFSGIDLHHPRKEKIGIILKLPKNNALAHAGIHTRVLSSILNPVLSIPLVCHAPAIRTLKLARNSDQVNKKSYPGVYEVPYPKKDLA